MLTGERGSVTLSCPDGPLTPVPEAPMPPMRPPPALLFAALLPAAEPVAAQVSVTADAGLLSAYVWRGVSLTNQAVAHVRRR